MHAPAAIFTLHAIDTGRADPIPLCNSNGMENRIPPANPVYAIDVTRMFNNVGGATATEAVFFSTLTIGYGLVTQFTY